MTSPLTLNKFVVIRWANCLSASRLCFQGVEAQANAVWKSCAARQSNLFFIFLSKEPGSSFSNHSKTQLMERPIIVRPARLCVMYAKKITVKIIPSCYHQ